MGVPIGTEIYKQQCFQTKMDSINPKIQKLTKLVETSPLAAYYLYNTTVKHEPTYMQRIGIREEMIKKTGNELRILAESIVGQSISDENTVSEISNPTRYGGLAISDSHLVEKSRELYLRGQITTNDLKTKLIAQD